MNVVPRSVCDVANNGFYRWKIGTLNIRTGKEQSEGAKMYAIVKEVARLKLSICCIQEVRHRNYGEKMIRLNTGECYKFYWSGMKKRREYGVGILIKDDKNIKVSEPDTKDARLMATNIEIRGFKIRLVNAYAPTEEASENMKDVFYRDLRKACQVKVKHQKLFLAGDLNATTTVSLKHCEYDGNVLVVDDLCNDNGTRLKSFCRSMKLCMSQTYFDYPVEDRMTWYSGDGRTKKVLDYALVEKFIQRYIQDCSVCTDCNIETDHRLVLTSLSTPTSKKARKQPCRPRLKPKPDIKSLMKNNVKAEYNTAITEFLQHECLTHTPEKISERIIECLQTASDKAVPKMKTTDTVREIWKEDIELNALLQQRVRVDKYSDEYKMLAKMIKKRVKFLKNNKLEDEARKIDNFATRKEIDQLYRTFQSDSSPFKNLRKSKECDPYLLKQYFEKHFQNKEFDYDPVNFEPAPDFISDLQKIKCGSIKNGPPDLEELNDVIKKLKDGKSASDIPTAFIKHAMDNTEFAKEIVKLYETVWNHQVIPAKWGHSKLVAIWKGPAKGTIENPEAYRGLQIGSSLCKIMVIIAINRLKSWYECQLADQQQGFRSDRSTTDGIYIAKRVQQITRSSKKTAYLLFVDLSSAFDHVERKWLFETIKKRLPANTDLSLIHLLEHLYSFTTTALSQAPDQTFETKSGVRQGGPESPILFNLFMDFVMRVFLDQCKKDGISFLRLKYLIPAHASNTNRAATGTFVVDWVGYADDLLLVFEDKNSLVRGTRLLNAIFRRFHLEINTSKTKTMILNHDGEYPESIVSLNGIAIANVEAYLYLGSTIKYDEASTGDTELNLRIDGAESKFYSLGKKFLNKRIRVKTRVRIFNALVRNRLVYSCPIWTTSSIQLRKINSSYMSMLRKMVRGGFKRKENDWAFAYSNADIKRICDTSDATDFIRRQQLKYVAHIVRKDNKSILKRLFFNSDDRRIAGAPQATLKSIVLKDCGCSESRFYKQAMERRF